MGIRDVLNQRQEQRDNAANGGENGNLPEGVTRYVKIGSYGEVNAEGKTLIILADPDNWFVYFVHEDKEYNGKGYDHAFRKHTCLHSPHELSDDILDFAKKDGSKCLSCKAGAKRKMYFMIPVFDPQYNEWRVIDTVEFHANNLIDGYDTIESASQEIDENYSLVGRPVVFKQSDKTYAMSAGKSKEFAEAMEAAKPFIGGVGISYGDLANFREESDIIALLNEGNGEKIDKSVLPKADAKPAENNDDNAADPTEAF